MTTSKFTFPKEHQPDREVLLVSRWGSHHFNLTTPDSDDDYFIFTMPTFDDLYRGYYHQRFSNGHGYDFSFRDIRTLEKLLFHVNFVDMLYAENSFHEPEIKQLIEMRDSLALMDLPGLYEKTMQKHMNDMLSIQQGKPEKIEKYGYNTINAMHSYRALDFLQRFHDLGFMQFDKATRYGSDETSRQLLLDLKTGKYSLIEVITLLEEKRYTVSQLYDAYAKYEPNMDTIQKMQALIKQLVERRFRAMNS